MFTTRYFNPRYWAQRFWPKVGGEAPDFPACDSGGYSRVLNLPEGKNSAIVNLSGGSSELQQLSGGYSRIIVVPSGNNSTIENISGGRSLICQ